MPEQRLIEVNAFRESMKEQYSKTERLIRIGENHLDHLAEGFFEVDQLLSAAPTVNAVVLPCEFGDTVYVDRRTMFDGNRMKGISDEIAIGEVVSFRKNKKSTFAKIKFFYRSGRRRMCSFVVSAFGKTVFCTPEAAEAALAERRADG